MHFPHPVPACSLADIPQATRRLVTSEDASLWKSASCPPGTTYHSDPQMRLGWLSVQIWRFSRCVL